ncbi:hypothetical protein CVT26_009771 [Gymnopilus dilepis]|uniref:Uncharacterized protein n=1 Tax=Gymnopilus dilepis TaxID=231916 RepID=A0A409YIT6_9AGAR|nr:hypothetical protein CVT26_009771 [Gymnopilus dilepis]
MLSYKLLVSAVWGFETIHQALITHTIYYYLITNYNNPNALDHLVWYGEVHRSILLEVLFNVSAMSINWS